METNHLRILAGLSAASLLVAVLHMPYGYYQLLRIIVCLVGCVVAARSYSAGAWFIAVFAALAAAVFNPLVPLHFDRDTWAALNLSFAAGFVVVAIRLR